MEKNYEEFFYSEDPQEIEKEKKKRNILHSLFPNLMGGKEDRTNYVLKENNKIKEPSANTKDPTFLENDQKEFNFESWKKSTKQIINNFDHKNNTNTQKAITPFRIDDTKKRKENDLTAPDYNELELENTNKPTKHTIANDFLKFDNKKTENKIDSISNNDKGEMSVTFSNDSLKTKDNSNQPKKVIIYGNAPIKNYDKQINELKQKLPKEALDILNRTGTEIKVIDNLHLMYSDGKRSKQQGVYTSNKIILDSKKVNFHTLFSETVHAAQDYLGMTNYGKANLEFQEHVIKDLYNTQRLLKTGNINYANSYSVAFDNRYKKLLDNIFDNNGNLILDKFLIGISPFIEEFQKNYTQSNSYQNKGVDNYNYNWTELLNIFEIEYK
jgi:hypothetical protein